MYTNSYSGKDASSYAYTHALKPNPSYRYFASHGDGGGDCSNFISQCLRAGGAPMAYSGPWPWWYKDHAWSLSWSVAHSLYWCLKERGKLNLPGLKGIEVPDIDMLNIGDVIQYEDKFKKVYHSAIITDFTYDRGSRLPLISQHSYDALNVSHIKPKAVRMHFMKIVI